MRKTRRPPLSVGAAARRRLLGPVLRAGAVFAQTCPGESGERQPVCTAYGGAQLFRPDSAPRLGMLDRAGPARGGGGLAPGPP